MLNVRLHSTVFNFKKQTQEKERVRYLSIPQCLNKKKERKKWYIKMEKPRR
jgi:hypothetical protein